MLRHYAGFAAIPMRSACSTTAMPRISSAILLGGVESRRWHSSDGGSCVTPQTVAEPIAAVVRDVGAWGEDGQVTLAIVGRVADREIRTVRFEGFLGEFVERPVGENGFFVARAEARICPDEDWTSTFIGLDADGNEVARAAIMLIDVQVPKKELPTGVRLRRRAPRALRRLTRDLSRGNVRL
jgi:hypothetical protein